MHGTRKQTLREAAARKRVLCEYVNPRPRLLTVATGERHQIIGFMDVGNGLRGSRSEYNSGEPITSISTFASCCVQ
jgi:hypothetical protein